MVKYVRYLAALVLFSLNIGAMEPYIQTMEESINTSIAIKGKSAHFTYRSIKEGDDTIVEKIINQCNFKEGFPDKPVEWSKNLIKRQEGGNSYSAVVLEEGTGPVAILGLGRMPVLNYDPKFTDIIQTYLDFGVIRLKNAETKPDFAKENIEQVDNQGIAIMLPVLPHSLGKEKIREALQIGVNTVKFLKNFTLLPLEKTKPSYLIGLYDPQDPLIPCLKEAGFEILEKEGFDGYYSTTEVRKPRIMAYMKL